MDKMKMTNKKICLNFLVIGIFVVVLLSLVNAIGFSSNDRTSPLEVYPGEIRNININVFPSSTEEGNRVIRIIMEEDVGIATLTDSSLEYNTIIGQNTPVNMRISIPSNAAIGTEYAIRLKAEDITPSTGGGTVGLTTSSTIFVYLKVIEKPVIPTPTETPKPESNALWWVLGAIVIVAIILVIYFTLKGKKK